MQPVSVSQMVEPSWFSKLHVQAIGAAPVERVPSRVTGVAVVITPVGADHTALAGVLAVVVLRDGDVLVLDALVEARVVVVVEVGLAEVVLLEVVAAVVVAPDPATVIRAPASRPSDAAFSPTDEPVASLKPAHVVVGPTYFAFWLVTLLYWVPVEPFEKFTLVVRLSYTLVPEPALS